MEHRGYYTQGAGAVKAFTSDWIAHLNANHSGGVFFLAVAITVGPGDIRYYADTQRSIVFDGQTYNPRYMAIDGLGQTSQQNLPAVRLVVSNVLGDVGTFLETFDLSGHDIVVRLLHLDLLGSVSNQDSVQLQVLTAECDEQVATFSLGLNIGLSEILPRHLITAAEFPGVPEGLRRASIL